MLLLGEILLNEGPYFAGMFLHRRICIYATNITFNSVIQDAVCQTFNHLIRSPTVFFFFFPTIDTYVWQPFHVHVFTQDSSLYRWVYMKSLHPTNPS